MAGFTACMVANHQKVKNSLTLKSFPFCLTMAILYGVSVKNMNKHKTNTHMSFHSTITKCKMHQTERPGTSQSCQMFQKVSEESPVSIHDPLDHIII